MLGLSQQLQEKWAPVLEHGDLPKIEDNYKKAVTSILLENQERVIREERQILSEAIPTMSTGSNAAAGAVQATLVSVLMLPLLVLLLVSTQFLSL